MEGAEFRRYRLLCDHAFLFRVILLHPNQGLKLSKCSVFKFAYGLQSRTEGEREDYPKNWFKAPTDILSGSPSLWSQTQLVLCRRPGNK